MDGWGAEDDPLVEHINHSPACGWAIVTAIELEYHDYAEQDPSLSVMRQAREDTFADKWPYESLSGWKCKTKRLADAGWKYTPSVESKDMATCVYCQLALDGWEPKDDPMYEHLRRSPNCAYFRLLKAHDAGGAMSTNKRSAAKGKGRASKHVPRRSPEQSAVMEDATANVEDSVMTTSCTGTRKTTRKKATATTTKGRKTRAKKEETIVIAEDTASQSDDLGSPPKPATKTRATRSKAKPDDSSIADVSVAASMRGRGKKRASDVLEDSAGTQAEAPAPKKRATRGKAKVADKSVAKEDAPPRKSARKGRAASGTKKKKPTAHKTLSSRRKASAVSAASAIPSPPLRLPAAEIADDEVVEQQLLADLDKPFSEDEHLHGDSIIERQKMPGKSEKDKKTSLPSHEDTVLRHAISEDYIMFDPDPHCYMDEDELSRELDAVEVKMRQGSKPGPSALKNGGGASRSSQVKVQPELDHEPEVETEPEPEVVQAQRSQPAPVSHEGSSMLSSGTVVRNDLSETSEEASLEQRKTDDYTMDQGKIAVNDVSDINVAPKPSTERQPAKRGRGRPHKKNPSLEDEQGPKKVEKISTTYIPALPPEPTPMVLDEKDENSSASDKGNAGAMPGAFPRAFLTAPLSHPRPPPSGQDAGSPARKPEPPPKDLAGPLLSPSPRHVEKSPAPAARSSVRLPRPVSPSKQQKTPVAPSPFRQAVLSPLRAVQAVFSSPGRAGFLSQSKENLAIPCNKKLASPSKELPLIAASSRHSAAALPAQSVFLSQATESLASSPMQEDIVCPPSQDVENLPPSSPLQEIPSTGVSLQSPILRTHGAASAWRHDDTFSPSGGDAIMSDASPGTPTPARHAPPMTYSSLPQEQHHQHQQKNHSPLKNPPTHLTTHLGHGIISPSASARQPVMSPSQSPQSSDAENRSPSSRPASFMSKRPILAPLPPKTPARMLMSSTARRNRLGAIQTSVPWSPIDLEKVFGSETELGEKASEFFDPKDDGGSLSHEELNMTVEEWVRYRGERAEEFVKRECEDMVMGFERKGMMALRAVKGLVVSGEE